MVATNYAFTRSPVLHEVAEPDGAAVEHLAAFERHRRDRSALTGIGLRRVEDARRALGTVDGRADDEADLIHQTGTQEGAVGAATTFKQQALHAEIAVEDLQGEREIDLGLAG